MARNLNTSAQGPQHATQFASALGFANITEALFAQSQALGKVRKMPSYASAVQGKLAALEAGVDEALGTSTSQGIAITTPAAMTFPATYLGVLTPNPFPIVLNFGITLFGNSVISDPRTVVSYVLNGVTGSQTAPGVFTVTGLTKLSADVTIRVEFAGVLQGNYKIPLTTIKATTPVPPPPPPPPPPSPTPVAPVQTPTQGIIITPALSTLDFTLVGSIAVVGGFNYGVSLVSDFVPSYSTVGASNVEVYIAYKTAAATSWTPIGASAVGTPAAIRRATYRIFEPDIYFDTNVGSINIYRSIVLPTGSYIIGIFAKQLYSQGANFQNDAVLEAL